MANLSSRRACLRNCWRQVRRRSWTWQKEESQAEGTQTRKPSLLPTTNYIYPLCSKDCHSRIGLTRHRQCCSSRNTTISYGTLLRQNKSAQSPKKPILICFGKFLVLKLARTYDELNKYQKKKVLCHRHFDFVNCPKQNYLKSKTFKKAKLCLKIL